MSDSDDRFNSVLNAIVGVTGKPCGDHVVPGSDPKPSFTILSSFGGGLAKGSMDDQMDNRDVRFAVKMVGVDPKQVRWLRDKVLTLMIYGTPWPAAHWASLEGEGAIVPDGPDLYSATDTYLMRI